MQDNNGDGQTSREGVEHHRVELDAEDLQYGPVVDNDARAIVADEDMVANEEEFVLGYGGGSSFDTRYALLPHFASQVHGRSPDSTKNSPDHKKTRAIHSASQDVEDRPSGTTRVLDSLDSMDDNGNDKRRRLDNVNQFDDM